MRVAIDATPLACPTGGIRRYVVELTRALAVEFPGDSFYLLTDQAGWQLPDSLRGLPNVCLPAPDQQRLRTKWWSVGLALALRRHGIDIFHGANFEIPYLPVTPSVLTVHDLSPWKEAPYRAHGSERVRDRTPFLLRMASLLLVPTQAIRLEMSDHFGIPISRIRAVPLAAAEQFQPAAAADVTDWLQAIGVEPPYLVALSDAQPRKNVARLVDSWELAKASHPGLKLVLVGAHVDAGAKPHGQPGLHILEHLSDYELRTLLSGAVAFVYPSLYEGFGLPLLEAMQTGVPVIASHDRALSEVSGDAALHVDTLNVDLLRQAIEKVVASRRLQDDLRAKGLRRSARFGWPTTALLTRQTYVEAIGRF